MAHLVPLDEFSDCGIPDDDPLRWHYHPVAGRFYRRRLDVAVELLGTGGRVLDLGYGSGTSFLELGSRFEQVYGLDRHEYGARIAGVFARHNLHVRLVRGDVLSLPYAADRFDSVVAVSMLEHLRPETQQPAMHEMGRVLRSGGRLVIGVPGVNKMMSACFRLMGFQIDESHLSTPAIVRAAAATEFVIDRIVSQPPGAPSALLSYQWIRAFKP